MVMPIKMLQGRNLPPKVPVLDKVPFLPFDGEGAKV
jgi:hypothetical protein